MPSFCKNPDCNKYASYNFADKKSPIYCKNHIEDGMIYINHPKCINCNLKVPVFNYPDEKKAIYCGDCKLPDMIDIKNPKCINCNLKRPYFNYPDEKKAIYCGDCKLPDMIDVKHKKCIVCNLKIPYFNYPDEKKAIYCGDCKKTDMINVISTKCITNLCEQQSQKDNYCMRCYYFHNPDKKPERLKVKEEEVIKYIKNNFKNIDMITDKCLIGDGLCLRTRPDILIHLNNHSIIIEIDENQHKWYNPICDEARINNIQEALNRPIIIIRFNPDAYTDKGKRIKSCFKDDDKTGLKTIPKNQELNWNNRLSVLKNIINDNLEYLNDEPIKLIKLFYDTY
jgi:hypothetical protein